MEQSLFGGTKVGYSEDLLVWETQDELVNGLLQRIHAIKAQGNLISTANEATRYFETAARRKEPVFFSYSGANKEIGAELSAALNRRFQKVFDYRDGKSIRPGQPWITEIFGQLSTSALGISLLSQGYLDSGNCLHEAQQMVAQLDSKKMKFVPVSLADAKYEMPPWLSIIQALVWTSDKSADNVVQEIVKSLDE